jgi:hypothetical protein
MAQLVFSSISGGTVTLNGPNTAGTYNLAVPAANGTLLYQDLTGNITFNNVTVTGTLSITGTSAFRIPVGNTVQRPAGPAAGDIRYNTDGGGLYEVYLPALSQWQKIVTAVEGQYTITYLIVSGGGGGGAGTPGGYGGGGGAGGLLSGTFTAIPSTLFSVVVGGGGAVSASGTGSYIVGVATANGGGRGADTGIANASSGGSGGGGAYAPSGGSGGGSGINGQGFKGGDNFDTYYGGGGGGGSSAAGAYANNGSGGAGGAGTASTITGVVVYYAGGGGGGSSSAGGVGGGGNAGSPGLTYTGGGGGAGGAGGSGVVIISLPTANYTGTVTGLPTVTTSGSNTIIKFTNSGSYSA